MQSLDLLNSRQNQDSWQFMYWELVHTQKLLMIALQESVGYLGYVISSKLRPLSYIAGLYFKKVYELTEEILTKIFSKSDREDGELLDWHPPICLTLRPMQCARLPRPAIMKDNRSTTCTAYRFSKGEGSIETPVHRCLYAIFLL